MTAKRLSKPKKSLGQHFLMHPSIAERMVLAAHLPEGATVLEVGPGKGILTRALLSRATKVIAVEIDAELYEGLREKFKSEIASSKLELIQGDIRNKTLDAGIRGAYQVVANIPYYLTGELIRSFLSAEHQPESMTLLLQKEVAERIARANPDVKESGPRPKRRGKESLLSLSVKVYGIPSYEFTVPKGAFIPPPKVDSAVLTIRNISRKNFKDRKEEQRFFEVIHAGFAHKRKYVRSNLALCGLAAGSLPEKARAEDLSLRDWLALIPSTAI